MITHGDSSSTEMNEKSLEPPHQMFKKMTCETNLSSALTELNSQQHKAFPRHSFVDSTV